ncbi:PAS domain-containing sensor histidine kinase [Halorubrum vacuolatum]|uniref:histidine kinase n=1 Tax=Halorubrum vacuolatum TaxID=63740 RepID=A0A238VP56_HALVU|nr:PAS domain-containing sensor histidine kinase [Halorubrum vacuolatum]SNR36125.1 PAS domain S-box-containing protein [Halorubrum vacuolatum]
MPEESPGELLLDHINDLLVVIDADGTYRYVNAVASRVVGEDPSELLGTNAFDRIHPDDRERVLRTFSELVDAETPTAEATISYRFRSADGSWIWLESRCSNHPVTEIGGYVVSSRDVTDRLEAEHARDETAARLDQIADSTDDVLWMFSGDWSEVLFVNRAYESLYGGDVDTLKRDPSAFLTCTHPDDRASVLEAMGRLSDGEELDIEYRVNPDQGYHRWVWVRGRPIVEDGEVVRVAGFSRDVTDRRRRRRHLGMLDTVLRHNLRNDLNKILGYVETVQDEDIERSGRTPDDERVVSGPGGSGVPDLDPVEWAEVVRQVSDGLLEKADKQREITRILTERPPVEPVDLAAALEGAIETVSASFPDVAIEVSVPSSLPVAAIPSIEIAMMELIENAATYDSARDTVRDHGPGIHISADRDDDAGSIVLEIVDHNPPIPEYDHRVLTGEQEMPEVHHSSGVGLWLVYWIVDLSGGYIEYERVEGRNVVRIRLSESDGSPMDTDAAGGK